MKKFLALFLAALMLLSLVACASDGQTEQAPATDTVKETQSTQQTVPSTEEAPAEAEQTGSVLADINGDGKITIACVHRNLLGATGVNLRAAYYYTAAQMDNVELLFFDGNQDVTAQCNYIEDCMASKACDAFIVWTCDPDGIVGTVQIAHDAGYPIIVVDISLNCDQEAFVAAGNYDMGVLTGQSAVECLTEMNGEAKGRVYIITASNQSTARDRVAGFESVISEYPGIEVIGTYDMPTSSVDDGVALADDLIQQYPEGTVDMFFCMNMSPMLGLLSAAATAGRTDFYLVGGFDHDDTFIKELQKGKGNTVLYSFAAQDCFETGSKAFELAVEAAKGNLPAEKNVLVPGELVTVETLDDYLETYNFYQEQILAYQ